MYHVMLMKPLTFRMSSSCNDQVFIIHGFTAFSLNAFRVSTYFEDAEMEEKFLTWLHM